MTLTWNSCVFVVCLQLLVIFFTATDGSSGICIGDQCKGTGKTRINLNVLGAYCQKLCYGSQKEIYDYVCDCKKIVTTPPPPCKRSYLQNTVCEWAAQSCNGSSHCEWRKDKTQTIVKSENLTEACGCYLKETDMNDPCQWKKSETVLCLILKESKLLYRDFQCLCDVSGPTTPPEKSNVCEYTRHRPAQLSPNRRKRLFSGSSAYSCNYPGVVGLFTTSGSDMRSVCTATLLNEDTILMDHQCKLAIREPMYALVDFYDSRVVNEASTMVKLDSISPVDNVLSKNTLYTAKLAQPVTRDDKCVQPACLPNIRTPVHHIDLNDCRVLGYGDTSDTFITGPQAKTLQEIRVKVNPTSVTGDLLEVTRQDGYRNTACSNDFSSPLVCAHKYTKEWITIGIHQYAGVVCSGKSKPNTFQVANLLSETIGNRYYQFLIGYQPKPESPVPEKK